MTRRSEFCPTGTGSLIRGQGEYRKKVLRNAKKPLSLKKLRFNTHYDMMMSRFEKEGEGYAKQ